jgi:hypothetical protein
MLQCGLQGRSGSAASTNADLQRCAAGQDAAAESAHGTLYIYNGGVLVNLW